MSCGTGCSWSLLSTALTNTLIGEGVKFNVRQAPNSGRLGRTGSTSLDIAAALQTTLEDDDKLLNMCSKLFRRGRHRPTFIPTHPSRARIDKSAEFDPDYESASPARLHKC